jgi:hypothetical protein
VNDRRKGRCESDVPFLWFRLVIKSQKSISELKYLFKRNEREEAQRGAKGFRKIK